jgi:hypothetical protein
MRELFDNLIQSEQIKSVLLLREINRGRLYIELECVPTRRRSDLGRS